MTDTQPPATEADVVEAMAHRIADTQGDWGPHRTAIWRTHAETAMTAARSLGVLMPEEAAALREERDMYAGTESQGVTALLEAMAQRDALAARMKRAEEALRDARQSVVAFCGPWAVMHAKEHGLPEGHIFPTHYDILKEAGARMDSFTRAALAQPGEVGT